MRGDESGKVVKMTGLLGDFVSGRGVSSMSELSTGELGEGVESKEPGIGCERGVGKTKGVREDELEEGAEGFAGFLANLPVIGSR